MKRYKFFNIKWDTDGQSAKSLNLPNSVEWEAPYEDFDPENEGADLLSDKYGFCVFSFEFIPVP